MQLRFMTNLSMNTLHRCSFKRCAPCQSNRCW